MGISTFAPFSLKENKPFNYYIIFHVNNIYSKLPTFNERNLEAVKERRNYAFKISMPYVFPFYLFSLSYIINITTEIF